MTAPPTAPLTAHPLTPDRFADLGALFGAEGCSFARSCWCMDHRLSGRVTPPEGTSVAEHRRGILRVLAGGTPAPGLIGCEGGPSVGSVSVAPREGHARLRRSPIMRPVDDLPVRSIVCFVVDGAMRGRGVARALLDHAVDHARAGDAPAVEGCPGDREGRSWPQFLWHGTRAMFEAAGFRVIARRKPERPVMRLNLGAG